MIPQRRLIVGCMTGTSLDGLDAAAVEVMGHALEIIARPLGCISVGLPDPLRATLLRLAEGEAMAAVEIMHAAGSLGELHARSVLLCCQRHAMGERPHLVAAHGQTICHAPPEPRSISERSSPGFVSEPRSVSERSSCVGMSWQLLDPWPIVRRCGSTVVHDLRGADLIAGGQGAPITPLADWLLLRHVAKRTVVVNLGGICNVTVLRGSRTEDVEHIRAADVGPCNLLLDGVAWRVLGERYDEGGRAAMGGTVYPFAGGVVGVYDAAEGSLGREGYGAGGVERLLASAPGGASSGDILASVVAAVAGRIAGGIASLAGSAPATVVLAGGGVRNAAVVAALRERLGMGVPPVGGGACFKVVLSDEVGLPHEAREAAGMAVLGAVAEDGVAITLEGVTGASDVGRAGRWVYP